MALYAISDLHLAISIDKPMDIFGDRWTNYMQKLKENWKQIVREDDFVIIPGDISWATYLEQAVEDFRYIEELPGKKIISKGNHDYWWTTASKLEKFKEGNNFTSISFMHNNSYKVENIILCGTRGWKCPGDEEFSEEDAKIYRRELQRLELSLASAGEIHENQDVMVAMHYPPFNARREPSEFVEVMKKYNVGVCIYGHLHSHGFKNAVEGELDGISYKLVSADYLNFMPVRIY